MAPRGWDVDTDGVYRDPRTHRPLNWFQRLFAAGVPLPRRWRPALLGAVVVLELLTTWGYAGDHGATERGWLMMLFGLPLLLATFAAVLPRPGGLVLTLLAAVPAMILACALPPALAGTWIAALGQDHQATVVARALVSPPCQSASGCPRRQWDYTVVDDRGHRYASGTLTGADLGNAVPVGARVLLLEDPSGLMAPENARRQRHGWYLDAWYAVAGALLVLAGLQALAMRRRHGEPAGAPAQLPSSTPFGS